MQVKGWWCLESINEFEIQTLTKSAFDFRKDIWNWLIFDLGLELKWKWVNLSI